MFIHALELKIELFSLWTSHLEIQDGRHIKWILVITIGYSMPENMGIDTKIMTLCALEMKLGGQIWVFGSHFEICKLGTFPPLGFP